MKGLTQEVEILYDIVITLSMMSYQKLENFIRYFEFYRCIAYEGVYHPCTADMTSLCVPKWHFLRFSSNLGTDNEPEVLNLVNIGDDLQFGSHSSELAPWKRRPYGQLCCHGGTALLVEAFLATLS